MKLIVTALIGSFLLVSCASKPEASKPETTGPMTLEETIAEPYKADQSE
jgi:hypothetical protein